MKKLFLISILLCYTTSSYCQTNFSGDWYFEDETSNFSLNLSQINNIVKGTHCAIADSGDYIDCAYNGVDTSITINGTVQGDSILVTFESACSGTQGTAVIKRINSTQIQWRILKQPDGISYIPSNVVLNFLDSPLQRKL